MGKDTRKEADNALHLHNCIVPRCHMKVLYNKFMVETKKFWILFFALRKTTNVSNTYKGDEATAQKCSTPGQIKLFVEI